MRTDRRKFLVGAASLAATSWACGGWAGPAGHASGIPGLRDERGTTGGRERTWSVLVPETAKPSAPLVLGIHGHNQDASVMYWRNGWAKTLTELGWIGVFPNTYDEAQAPNGDRDFMSFLLDKVGGEQGCDPRRVYAVGFSNGGKKCYWLAAHRKELTAIAVHSGWIGSRGDESKWMPSESCGRPSILHLHGGRDPVVPIDGTKGNLGMTPVPYREALEQWATHLGAEPVEPVRPPFVPDRVEAYRWACPDGVVIAGFLDPEMKHRWADNYANRLITTFLASAVG